MNALVKKYYQDLKTKYNTVVLAWAHWLVVLHRRSGMFSYPFRKAKIKRILGNSIGKLTVEVSNTCNANCVFCAYQYQERPQQFMSMELFEKVILEYVAAGGTEVSFTPTVGDAMTDKLLISRIKYARSFDQIKRISMTSNLISMQLHGAKNLIEAGLDVLHVSISGLDEEMYKRVYRSNQYQKVMSNIREFIAVNSSLGNPVDFNLSMRSDRELSTVAAYPDYLDIKEKIGVKKMEFNLRYDNWAGKISKSDLTGEMQLRGSFDPIRLRVSPCAQMYSGPMVYSNGKVGACGCRDLDARELILGDASEENLNDIWNNQTHNKMRDEFLTDKVRDICKNCTHYYSLAVFAEKKQYEALSDVKKNTPS